MAYREEHPKPQFMREHWQNLNGQWQFEIDRGESGLTARFTRRARRWIP